MSWINTAVDKLTAGAILLCLSPLLGVIALAIKVEGLFDPAARGPAIWTTTRISQGERFGMFKFRTVLAHRHPDEYDKPGKRYTTYEDNPNATRVGRFLLKWYLDELPQLFNVLRGEMRLVGPRPVPPWEYELELSEGADSKRRVKAGWAGLTQAYKGRSASRHENMRLDAEYVRKAATMSPGQRLRYDLNLLLQTLRTALRGKGL
ncbi:sugar transferase [Nitrospinae bacterium AH_259_B05_G02_I21]|nr:sugar transferase [Nitrospinae bacterium AH_259_B05_G02_I21]MDA2931924.1 sugar transferase [Nitrospinae bacterium AH-259-F20]